MFYFSVRKMKRKKRIVKRDYRGLGLKSKVGASIPVDLERQKGIFDYLKWHEINRKDNIAVFKSKFNFERANSQSRHSPFMVNFAESAFPRKRQAVAGTKLRRGEKGIIVPSLFMKSYHKQSFFAVRIKNLIWVQ